jgi:hypothetical protein
MSRFTHISRAVRRPAVASSAAGLAIALAVTGVAVASPTAAESAGSTTTSSHDASYATKTRTQTTQSRAAARAKAAKVAKAHNPRGTSRVHRAGKTVRFHGHAIDPDNRHVRLVVLLWHNGHKVATVKTTKHTHHYKIWGHLTNGKNRLTVSVKNIGRGTHPHARLRSAVMHWSWASNYGGRKGIAASMFKQYGWGQDQMQSLINLWNRESGWSTTAANSSGAYGIPQALPGSKMSSAGPDWAHNAHTQIRWGLGYIADRYGSPNAAWGHSQSNGWY